MNKEPELVDLGLPSGNLWMKYNLGATSETGYGNYYQFGSLKEYSEEEILNHSAGKWKTCPFNNGKDRFDKEYFLRNRYKVVYKNEILKPEFDVVTQTYGPGFKIPDSKDFQELLDNTISEVEVNIKKGGMLFTSKINGKTLFFPFSGDVWSGGFYGVGSRCRLWSGRLYSSIPGYAYCLYCVSDCAGLYDDDCAGGFTLRGIKIKDE